MNSVRLLWPSLLATAVLVVGCGGARLNRQERKAVCQEACDAEGYEYSGIPDDGECAGMCLCSQPDLDPSEAPGSSGLVCGFFVEYPEGW
jgi:hypothetical protein